MTRMDSNARQRFTSVVDMVRDFADADFVAELEEQLASRVLVKALIVRRITCGLTQAEFARRCGMSEHEIARIESSADSEVSSEDVQRILEASTVTDACR